MQTKDASGPPDIAGIVYRVSHTHPSPQCEGVEEFFHIGIFSSYEKASEVVKALSSQPGFCDHLDGFEIAEDEIDLIGWSEGYVTV